MGICESVNYDPLLRDIKQMTESEVMLSIFDLALVNHLYLFLWHRMFTTEDTDTFVNKYLTKL